jgi:hypothetical protein
MNAGAFAPVQANVVARLYLGDTRPNLLDDSAAFMAEKVRQKLVGALDRGNLAELRAANAADSDADEHLPDIETRQLDLIEQERSTALFQDGGPGLHSK